MFGGIFIEKVLEDLYFGEIQPNISNFDHNPHLNKLLQAVDENEEILLEKLKGKERELFLDLINVQSESLSTSAMENFINGFKLCTKLMIEALN